MVCGFNYVRNKFLEVGFETTCKYGIVSVIHLPEIGCVGSIK